MEMKIRRVQVLIGGRSRYRNLTRLGADDINKNWKDIVS